MSLRLRSCADHYGWQRFFPDWTYDRELIWLVVSSPSPATTLFLFWNVTGTPQAFHCMVFGNAAQPRSHHTRRRGTAIRRRKLITHPTAANPAPSTSATVAPSRPASPKQSAASAEPVVCPIRRAVATMPLAPPLRPTGALAISVFMFGVWK